MQLFYAPEILGPTWVMSEAESRHAVRVLRLTEGSRLHVTDGRGNMYEAEVVVASPKECQVRIVEAVAEYEGRKYKLVMGVAPTKNLERWEWFVEKATEVGVDVVVPLECTNSERRVLKTERSEKVAVEAMKQSLKAYLPEIEPMTPLRKVLEQPFEGVKLIAHCRPGSERTGIEEALRRGEDAMILIGPEGDFTAEEVAMAEANGFKAISLGQSRLRTETAALTAVVAAYLKNN